MSATQFLLPDLGEGLTESEVVQWRVAAGDAVTLNQVIAEVETAKALVEIPSPYEGVVSQLHAGEGDVVQVGEPLITFEVDGEDDGEPEPTDESSGSGTRMQEPGPDSSSGADDESSGPNLVGYGAKARSAKPTRRRRKPVTWPQPAPSGTTANPADQRELDRRRATPGVRAMAKRLGVDLASVPGTGDGGKVTREDVEAVHSGAASAGAGPATARETREPVRGVRKHTAAAMVASVQVPQATVQLTVDVTATMDLLTRLREHRRTQGTRVTVLALVARAVCTLLPEHPSLTTRWHDLPDGGAELVRPAHVNLGIAAATDRGLVVPHIPAADTLSLVGLANALTELVETARAGRTAPERLTGSTMTITNVGIFGVDAGSPILNPGEPAILALGQIARRPWEHDGELALRQLTHLSLTFDHRVIDGEQASRFLADLGALLTDPGLALLGGPDDAPAATGGSLA